MSTANNAILKLNELLEKNNKARNGYKKAANEIENHALRNFLEGNSVQRKNFSQEIKETIANLGGEMVKKLPKNTISGGIWFDLKSAIAKKNNRAILEECERGERAALEDYDRLLKEVNIPETAKKVIKKQHDLIQSDLNKLENLRSGTF